MIQSFLRVVTFCCVLFGVLLPPTYGVTHDSTWVKPGALDRWGQQQKQGGKLADGSCESATLPMQCDCPPPPEPVPPIPCSADIIEDQRLALVFYRKLIKTLFARETLRADPATEDHYNVDLSLQITSRQLEKLLDDTSSAREVNLIVSAVLEKSSKTRRYVIFRENQCELLYNFLMQLFESKILHNALPLILLLLICFMVRIISRLTRIHSFIVFLLLILSITVSNQWKECNENLALQSLEKMETPPSFWKALFTSNKADSPLPICDPLQVIVESTVKIQAVYFKRIFKEILDTFKESTKDAGYIQSFIIGMLLLGFTYILITTLLSVGVRSGFDLFGNLVTTGMQSSRNTAAVGSESANNPQPQQLPAFNLNLHIGDSIAKTVPLNQILQQENQRIEIVQDAETTAIEEAPNETQMKASEPSTCSEHVEQQDDKQKNQKEIIK
uniref:Chloride channel CLIC-like protein 1 n=1 Tax=Anopheles culicifacies TaxID=139723 RepID=A0A182LSA8_9DIPT